MEAHEKAKESRPLDNPLTDIDPSDVYAAVDLGTNNCRLLVASPTPVEGSVWPTLRILDSYSRIVRLGEGVGANARLTQDAMDRTIKALKVCQSKLKKYPGAKVRCVATEACRRARNALDFVGQVADEASLDLEIISNEEEARLAFYGCCSLLRDETKQALTFDIGGGSTEFMWAKRTRPNALPDVVGWTSVPYGVMTLSELSGSSGYAEMYFEEITERIAVHLQAFNEEYDIRSAMSGEGVQLLSTSGTVTTLAAIHLDLQRYDRTQIDGITLSLESLRQSTRRLLEMSPAERYRHPCIGRHRADYIISGCAILEAICQTWPFAEITIADRGVREGIIMNLLVNSNG